MACNRGPSESELALMSESSRLKGELQTRDSLIADMTRSFTDIESNLAMIDEREKLMKEDRASTHARSAQADTRDIQLMNSLVKESRERIDELSKRLDKSKIESSGLRKKLKQLDAQLASRDSSMTDMKDQLLAKDFHRASEPAIDSAIELGIARREATIEQLN